MRNMMLLNKPLLLLSLFLSMNLWARDSMTLVCSAAVNLNTEGTKMPISIHFRDSRAEDGTSRRQVLSMIYREKLFQGIIELKTYGEKTSIKLSDKKNKREILFDGTYTLVSEEDYAWKLVLDGRITDDPRPDKIADDFVQNFHTELQCLDISI